MAGARIPPDPHLNEGRDRHGGTPRGDAACRALPRNRPECGLGQYSTGTRVPTRGGDQVGSDALGLVVGQRSNRFAAVGIVEVSRDMRRARDGGIVMSPRARTLTLAVLLAVPACSAPTSTQVRSDAPASVASSAAPSAASGGAPLVVGYAGSTPEGWVLPEGETVPVPDSEALFFEIDEGVSVMAPTAPWPPSPESAPMPKRSSMSSRAARALRCRNAAPCRSAT